MSIINNIMGDNNAMKDETIINDVINGGKAAATLYLNAAMESSTPELKAIYTSGLNQILAGQSAASAMAVNKRWYKPYDYSEQQLADAYKKSVSAVQNSDK